MTHRDGAGDPSGQRAGQRAGGREAAGDAGHRQGFPTPAPVRPLPVRLPDRNGGFPRLAGCVAHGLRCPASAAPCPKLGEGGVIPHPRIRLYKLTTT